MIIDWLKNVIAKWSQFNFDFIKPFDEKFKNYSVSVLNNP